MSKFHAIELAIQVATRQRDALAQKHAQAIRNLDFGKNQLSQLESYAADTDVRWSAGGGSVALSAELLRHHYSFMERLQGAVQMQTGVLTNLQAQVSLAHKALLQAEYRLAGFGAVLDARKARHAHVQARREQRITDEFASLRHTQNGAERRLGESV